MNNEHYDLTLIAKQVMQARGLQPDYPKEAIQQLKDINSPESISSQFQDLRHLVWCSIDNDTSLDLDQLTYGEKNADGTTTVWVAVADVDGLVKKHTPIDNYAKTNTLSVYTPTKIFSMLPEKLSTNLTSLNENEDRIAMVVTFRIDQQGELGENSIFFAAVHNYAKLAYPSVGAWLEGRGPIPEKIRYVNGLEQALRCQNDAAQILKRKRHALGALTLESPETEAKVVEPQKVILHQQEHNFAHQLIENFMIAANTVMSRTFAKVGLPGLRRVLRTPKRWERIVEIAKEYGETLPQDPDAKALENFLVKRKTADPVSFPDLSLTVIKLLGRGEYIVQIPGQKPLGHFGLALREYTHTTAPNRRFPDLIMQRQYKSYLEGLSPAYPIKELQMLADHCTQQEDAAIKVERHLNKSASAMLLAPYIGSIFKGIITGASEKGTWVRVFQPPVEGKLIRGFRGLDVGDQIEVKLVRVDIPNGYIDFERF